MGDVKLDVSELRQYIFDFYSVHDPDKLSQGLDVNGMALWTSQQGTSVLNHLLEGQYGSTIDFSQALGSVVDQVSRISSVYARVSQNSTTKRNSPSTERRKGLEQRVRKFLKDRGEPINDTKLISSYVDTALKHGEEVLMDTLYEKYGSSDEEGSDEESEEEEAPKFKFDELKVRQELRIFYQKHDITYVEQPEHIDKVLMLMGQIGKDAVYSKLGSIYKQPVLETVAEYKLKAKVEEDKKLKKQEEAKKKAPAPPARASKRRNSAKSALSEIDEIAAFDNLDLMRANLKKYYQKHDPGEIENIDDVIELAMNIGFSKLNMSMEKLYGQSLVQFLKEGSNKNREATAKVSKLRMFNESTVQTAMEKKEKTKLNPYQKKKSAQQVKKNTQTVAKTSTQPVGKKLTQPIPKKVTQPLLKKHSMEQKKPPPTPMRMKVKRELPEPPAKQAARSARTPPGIPSKVKTATTDISRPEPPLRNKSPTDQAPPVILGRKLSADDNPTNSFRMTQETVDTAKSPSRLLKSPVKMKEVSVGMNSSNALPRMNTDKTSMKFNKKKMLPFVPDPPSFMTAPPPTPALSPRMHGPVSRMELERFYNKHDKDKLGAVDQILTVADKIGRAKLNDKFYQYYGANLDTPDMPKKTSFSAMSPRLFKKNTQSSAKSADQSEVANPNPPSVPKRKKPKKKISAFQSDTKISDYEDLGRLRVDLLAYYKNFDVGKLDNVDQIVELGKRIGRKALSDKLGENYKMDLDSFCIKTTQANNIPEAIARHMNQNTDTMSSDEDENAGAKNSVRHIGIPLHFGVQGPLLQSVRLKKTGVDLSSTLTRKVKKKESHFNNLYQLPNKRGPNKKRFTSATLKLLNADITPSRNKPVKNVVNEPAIAPFKKTEPAQPKIDPAELIDLDV